MYKLFIDTHGNDVLIAIYKNDLAIKYSIVPSEQNHSTNTIPTIEKLIDELNLSIRNIDEIIVVNGPGSFTGVRIGVTVAKTLAYTLNIPIKVINSLLLYAISNNPNSGKIIALPDSKGFYFNMFNQFNQPMWEYNYLPLDEFKQMITEKRLERMVMANNLTINLDVIPTFMQDLPAINPHEVNPLYIKNVGVNND